MVASPTCCRFESHPFSFFFLVFTVVSSLISTCSTGVSATQSWVGFCYCGFLTYPSVFTMVSVPLLPDSEVVCEWLWTFLRVSVLRTRATPYFLFTYSVSSHHSLSLVVFIYFFFVTNHSRVISTSVFSFCSCAGYGTSFITSDFSAILQRNDGSRPLSQAKPSWCVLFSSFGSESSAPKPWWSSCHSRLP